MSKRLSFIKRSNLYYDDYDMYIIDILKEVIPRQLVSSYHYGLILKSESLKQHVNSITDVFNVRFDYDSDFISIRKDVEKILKDKYGFIIRNDKPLVMERYKQK